jgi:hypothetical protein
MCISYYPLDFAGTADYLEICAEWNIRFNRLIHLGSANNEINGLLIASRSMTLWCSFSLHFRWLWITALKTDRASAGFWKPYIIDEVPVSLNCSCVVACRYLVNKIELCPNRHRACEVDGFVVEEFSYASPGNKLSSQTAVFVSHRDLQCERGRGKWSCLQLFICSSVSVIGIRFDIIKKTGLNSLLFNITPFDVVSHLAGLKVQRVILF